MLRTKGIVSLVVMAGVICLVAMPTMAKTWYNPLIGGTTYTHTAPPPDPPAWAGNLLAQLLNQPLDTDYAGHGTVSSWAYYIDTTAVNPDITQGLYLVYQINMTSLPGGDLEKAVRSLSFATGDWKGYKATDAGTFGSGTSAAPSWATGTTWVDGKPRSITTMGDPGVPLEIVFANKATLDGTQIEGGDNSVKIWFEVPSARGVTMSHLCARDDTTQGEAKILIAPVPGALVLGAIGLLSVAGVRRLKRRRHA